MAAAKLLVSAILSGGQIIQALTRVKMLKEKVFLVFFQPLVAMIAPTFGFKNLSNIFE